MNRAQIVEDIKQIIYINSFRGAMCDDLEEGQIIGMKTGKGWELEAAAEGLADYFFDKLEEERRQPPKLLPPPAPVP